MPASNLLDRYHHPGFQIALPITLNISPHYPVEILTRWRDMGSTPGKRHCRYRFRDRHSHPIILENGNPCHSRSNTETRLPAYLAEFGRFHRMNGTAESSLVPTRYGLCALAGQVPLVYLETRKEFRRILKPQRRRCTGYGTDRRLTFNTVS
jgi:hypothetical protein